MSENIYNRIFLYKIGLIVIIFSIMNVCFSSLYVNASSDNVNDLQYFAYTEILNTRNNEKILLMYTIINIKISDSEVNVIIRKPSLDEFKEIINITGEQFTSMSVDEYYNAVYSGLAFDNITVKYYLDDRNYVKNFREVGFFPLYSVVKLDPELIMKLKPVYNGKPLECSDQCVSYFNKYNLFREDFTALSLRNGNNMLFFKWNYLVFASNVELPINETHMVTLGSVIPFRNTVSFLDSLPDYDVNSGMDIKLSLLVLVIIALLALFLVRRR